MLTWNDFRNHGDVWHQIQLRNNGDLRIPLYASQILNSLSQQSHQYIKWLIRLNGLSQVEWLITGGISYHCYICFPSIAQEVELLVCHKLYFNWSTMQPVVFKLHCIDILCHGCSQRIHYTEYKMRGIFCYSFKKKYCDDFIWLYLMRKVMIFETCIVIVITLTVLKQRPWNFMRKSTILVLNLLMFSRNSLRVTVSAVDSQKIEWKLICNRISH